MDEGFESVLIDLDGRRSLVKMGKLGILWQLDRTTGEFINTTDIGYQNILSVDPKTGEVRYRPGMIPEIGVEIEMCPSTSGFKSWRAMAFSPLTNALYIPLTLNCELAPPQDRNLVGAIGSDAQETLASRARSQRYREVVVGDYPPPSWGSSRSKYLGGNPVRIRNTMPRLCSRSTRSCSSDVTGTAR